MSSGRDVSEPFRESFRRWLLVPHPASARKLQLVTDEKENNPVPDHSEAQSTGRAWPDLPLLRLRFASQSCAPGPLWSPRSSRLPYWYSCVAQASSIAIFSGSVASRRLHAERLTATLNSRPVRIHCPHCRTASSSTHRVRGVISPVCSAKEMN